MVEILYKIGICLTLKYLNMGKEKIYQFYALSESDSPQEYRYVGVTSNSINSRFS
jgi:hypothetical protein